MNTYNSFGGGPFVRPSGKAASKASGAACRELAVHVTNIKNGLVREFGTALGGQNQLLQAALNEAEALAWQTPFPHLLFPLLAHEKASAASRWAARQRTVHRATREMSLTE